MQFELITISSTAGDPILIDYAVDATSWRYQAVLGGEAEACVIVILRSI